MVKKNYAKNGMIQEESLDFISLFLKPGNSSSFQRQPRLYCDSEHNVHKLKYLQGKKRQKSPLMKLYAPKGVELKQNGGNFQKEIIRNDKNCKVVVNM